MTRNTILAPLAGMTLLFAACGDDATVAPPAGQTTDTTIPADDSADDDGDALRSPTPIEAVTSGAAGLDSAVARTEAAPADAGADAAVSDMMIAPFVSEYVLADDFPALPTADTGYVFDGSADATAEQIAALASAFGLSEPPQRVDDNSWRVGPDDGTAPSLWVYTDPQQSWSYNSAWAESLVIEPCSVSIDSEGGETTDCPEPEPPVGVPSASEAEQRARDALASLGVDVGAVEFETHADEWSANVTVTETTDTGVAIRFWNFGFGGDGVLQYAGGTLATPEPVGPYDLVDLDTAFARLQERSGFGNVRPLGDDTPVAVGADESGAAPAVDEPLPVDDAGDREAVTVTLVDIAPDVWWVWDADDVLWLVPAYRFIDTDGGWHTVPAVSDEFLVEVEPPVDGPIPVEPDGGIGDGAEPLPEPDVSAPPAPTETIVGGETELGILEGLIGLSFEEFTAEAEGLGYEVRVVVQDGEPLIVTEDFNPDRVNVAVEGPRVVGVESIG